MKDNLKRELIVLQLAEVEVIRHTEGLGVVFVYARHNVRIAVEFASVFGEGVAACSEHKSG